MALLATLVRSNPLFSIETTEYLCARLAGAQLLIANITDTRNMVTENGWNIPVGTSDAGSYFNNEVLEQVDYGVSLSICLPHCFQKMN